MSARQVIVATRQTRNSMIEELIALRAWRDQAAELLKAIDEQIGIPSGYLLEASLLKKD